VDVGLGIGDGVGAREGLGIAIEVLSPLRHTNVLPAFTHVYLYPLLTFIELILVQEEPAFIAAVAGLIARTPIRRTGSGADHRLFTHQ
jgi:hypothetical protein